MDQQPSTLASVLAIAAVRAQASLANFLRTQIAVDVRTYRPEKYYMRGPGPKWREKNAPGHVSALRLLTSAPASRTTTENVDAAATPSLAHMPPRAATMMLLVRPASVTRLPQRPDPSILSDAIPLFFIGQNRDGFWVAREADGRVGGIFVLKQSALQFADKNAPPVGCAKMFLSERFELDIENKGNPLVARLGAAKRVLMRLAPGLPPS